MNKFLDLKIIYLFAIFNHLFKMYVFTKILYKWDFPKKRVYSLLEFRHFFLKKGLQRGTLWKILHY